jgi:RNA polymerase sigma-70 factor (ECF subfamily)
VYDRKGPNPYDAWNVASGEEVTALTDEELLRDHLHGRADRFELLVRRHSQELFHFLLRFTGSASTAEDIVQEAFLQVHLSAASFDQQRRFKPWLFTIAANKARDFLRSRARRPEVPLDAHVSAGNSEDGQRFLELLANAGGAPSDALEAAEQRDRVQKLVASMPEHLREVLVLSYYHRFPYKETADILSIPLGTVKSRLHAAVGHFARIYGRSASHEHGGA